MSAAMPEKGVRALRAIVEDLHFREGCCSLMAAFNMSNDASRAWAFAPSVHAKAKAKILELMELFRCSEIHVHPGAKALADARSDKAFDQFMMTAMRRPRQRH